MTPPSAHANACGERFLTGHVVARPLHEPCRHDCRELRRRHHACHSNPNPHSNPNSNPNPNPNPSPEPKPEPGPGADACNSILVPQNAELYHTCMVQVCRFLPEASKREDLPPPHAESAVLAPGLAAHATMRPERKGPPVHRMHMRLLRLPTRRPNFCTCTACAPRIYRTLAA